MGDGGSAADQNVWPLPKFVFVVKADDFEIQFQEVSGLDVETQIIEYRKSNSSLFSTEKMPGIAKYGNVTCNKGLFSNDNAFWDWYNQIKMNTIERRTVTISMLDEAGKPTMVWTLTNAWPTKVTGTDLKAEDAEVAIEILEFAHEGLSISNG